MQFYKTNLSKIVYENRKHSVLYDLAYFYPNRQICWKYANLVVTSYPGALNFCHNVTMLQFKVSQTVIRENEFDPTLQIDSSTVSHKNWQALLKKCLSSATDYV